MKNKIAMLKLGTGLVLLFLLVANFSGNLFAQTTLNSPPNNNQQGKKPEFVDDEIIVQFKPEAGKIVNAAAGKRTVQTGIGNIDNLNRKYGVSQITPAFKFGNSPKRNKQLAETYGLSRTFILKVRKGTDLEAAIKEYNQRNEVVYAETNQIYYPNDVPNDSLYHLQWGLNNTGQAIPKNGVGTVGTPGADINMEKAWGLHKGSSSTTLAILDTGIDYDHPEFAGRMVSGYDFINDDDDPMDDQNHGTACAGIAAAAGDNGFGVAGVNWNCLIMPIKIGASDGYTRGTSFSDGIVWAADNGADVLSMSYGGPDFSQLMQNAVNYAHSLGCILVASRGNNNTDAPNYPASYENVIAVGALSPCDERTSPTSCDGEAWGSSYGNDLDVMAPGTRIYTTDRLGAVGYDSGDYAPAFNGTSAACPFVAGAAALIWSYAPELSNDDIRDILQNTAVDIGDPGFDNETGFGRMDVYAALDAAKSYKSSFFGGKISLSDNTYSFSILPDANETLTLTISNIAVSDTADLIWKLSGDFTTGSWLAADVKRGRTQSGSSSQIQLTANTFGMVPGNYQTIVEVVSSDTTNRSEQVMVNLEVQYIPPPKAFVSPTSLNLALNVGAVAYEEISVSNIADPGARNLHWSASILGADLSWIDADISGAVTAAGTDTMIQVTINSGGLAAGNYNASIEISSNDSVNSFYQIPVTLSVAEPPIGGKKLYAFNFNEKTIVRSDLDGSNVSPVLVNQFRPGDGAVDEINHNLYWIDNDNSNIYKSNLNGLKKEAVLPWESREMTSIAIDPANSHIYWTESTFLRRINYDGTDHEYLLTTYFRSVNRDIALDIDEGILYWVLQGRSNPGVYRANVDGSNEELLIGGISPSSLALDLVNGILYWGARNTDGVDCIFKRKFDESNVQIVYSGIKINDLAIDAENGKLYWISNNEVFRGNTDGTNIESLNLTATNIALDLSPALPKDTVPPVAPTIQASIFLQCASEIPAPVALSAIDEFDGYITVLPTTQITSGTCLNNSTIVRTWTFTDKSGNTSSISQTIIVEDTTAPILESIPTNVSVECNNIPPPPLNVSAIDNCDSSPTIDFKETRIDGSCLNNYTLTRTWTATDACGNSSSESQKINVSDNTAPVLAGVPADITVECDNIPPPVLNVFATDNCDSSPTVDFKETKTDGSCLNNYTLIRTWTATDVCGNSDSLSQKITVEDRTAPVISGCPTTDFEIASTDAGQCYYTSVGTEFDISATDNCVGEVYLTYELSGATTSTGSESLSGEQFNYGATTVKWTATDECGNSSTCTFIVNVNSLQTVTMVTTDPVSQQYSDLVEFEATVTPWGCTGIETTGDVTFYVGTQAMGLPVAIDANGIATASYPLAEVPTYPSNGQMSPGLKTVTAAYNNTDPAYVIQDPSTTLTITPENTNIEYNGVEFQATDGSSSSEATVELRAVLQSVPDGSGLSGDIRNACVTVEINNTIVASDIKVELINPSDLTTGSIILPWTFDIGSADYESFDVKIIADCYFSGFDQTVVTVYKPVGDFITGGGHIKPTLSAGAYASSPDLKTNFGFHVKWNKKGKNLLGGMNIIFRQLIADEIQMFQIKTNSTTTLGVNTANPNEKIGEFESKATLKNITTEESLGGNLTLQVKIVDRGNPGSNDEIAITLWDRNTLLYSSEWTGVNSDLQYLANGNLVVQSGFELKSAEIAAKVSIEESLFAVELYPNPSTGEVNINIHSSEITESEVVVRSIIGSEIFRRKYLVSEEIKFDLSHQASGIYFIMFRQGENSAVKKLVLNRK